jgi:thiamine biosynthesis lipoprotein
MTERDRTDERWTTRRDALALGLGAFVVAAVPLAAARRPRLVRRQVPVMGTVAELAVVHDDPGAAQAGLDAAIAALSRVDGLMTRFTATSDVGRANRLAAAGPVVVSDATAGVLREALAWAEASRGAFDPCVGRAVRLWDVGHRAVPPAEAQVRRLAGRRLYRALDVDTWRGRPVVRLADPDAEIDLGGIAKGYGVDRAVDALRASRVRHAIVNVGGDLYALGESERGEPWTVGIRSPEDPSRLAGTLAIRDAAVATSGDYFQSFQYGGRRYHHLLDPATGAPRRTPVRSLTVTAATCLVADAAATAAFGLASDRVDALLRSRAPDARVVSVIGGPAGSA